MDTPSITLLLLLFSFTFFFSHARFTTHDLRFLSPTAATRHRKSTAANATNWAVLVAGSNGFGNYRHQADICHAYQILKKGGVKDENIIVFMYDDIANNEENPKKGIIINSPKGSDVYKGVPKDYTGDAVTASNLLGVIQGDKKAVKGGSGKVLKTGPNDHIFIYYSDHGSPGVLSMPVGDDLYAKDLVEALKKKHAAGTYKRMVIYIEACEAGSIFEGLLPEGMNIYVTTASNPTENSYATYCPDTDPTVPTDYQTCLGDLYSVSWMEDSDKQNPSEETLETQYQIVKNRTISAKDLGSHVMQYGNAGIGKDVVGLYIGTSAYRRYQDQSESSQDSSVAPLVSVDQHEADIVYLREKVRRAPEGSKKKTEAEGALEETLAHRKHVDESIEKIGKILFGSSEVLNKVRPTGQPIVDDWDCLKSMVRTYKGECGSLATYGKKYMRAFANICNAGVRQQQLAQASSQACKITPIPNNIFA